MIKILIQTTKCPLRGTLKAPNCTLSTYDKIYRYQYQLSGFKTGEQGTLNRPRISISTAVNTVERIRFTESKDFVKSMNKQVFLQLFEAISNG